MLFRLFRPKRRSAWRGFFASLICHYLAIAVLSVVFMAIRPSLWAALFGSPEWHSSGAVEPASAEGWILQTVAALSWLPAGAAALHWGGSSGTKSVGLALAYVAGSFAIGLVGAPESIPAFGSAPWYWLCVPTGLLLGVAVYRWWSHRGGGHQTSGSAR